MYKTVSFISFAVLLTAMLEARTLNVLLIMADDLRPNQQTSWHPI